MPRYFFHVVDGDQDEDLQGSVLPDLDAAREEAVRFAGALLREKGKEFWDSGEWHMIVADKTNLTLFQLTFFATESSASGEQLAHSKPPSQVA